jgi:predicted outer membrane repeat protein
MAGIVLALGLLPAQDSLADTPVSVPCNTQALASAITSATDGVTLNLAASCVYALKAPLPVIGHDLTITGNAATLDCAISLADAFTLLSVNAGTLTISQLNFRNGADAISATGNGSVAITGGTFRGNHAVNGGAISSVTGMGSLSVTGATFTGNTATGQGGAIYTNEAAALTTVSGSTFVNNTAGSGGGGIYSFFPMNVTSSVFARNKAADGGAIFNDSELGDILKDVTIRNNNATQDGGGVASYQCGLSVTDSQIAGNHAGSEGGGVYQDLLQGYPDGLTLTGTVVRANSAPNGAGIYGNDTVISLAGSTIENNDASVDGGGIFNVGQVVGYGDMSLGTGTISGNRAGTDGGGIYNTVGTVNASGMDIDRNTAGTGGGGIYDGPGPDSFTLANSPVQGNRPDNCEPEGSISGCNA